MSQEKGSLVQPLPTHRAGSWEVWAEPELGGLGAGRQKLAPREGVWGWDNFLPRSGNEEDRKHQRDSGGVREVERKTGELGGQEGGWRELEREARRPEGPRRGKKPGGWTLHGVRGESA